VISLSGGRLPEDTRPAREFPGAGSGFTYLSVLYLIVIMGIMAGAAGQSWHTLMKREREEELLFRGRQIKEAITRWNNPRAGEHVVTPLNDLKDLLRDPRTPHTVRYLRKMYIDPVTNSEWTIIRDPSRGIVGVASSSGEIPLKSAGFPDDLAEFAGGSRYSDWKFVCSSPGNASRGGDTQRKEKADAASP
jgi:type II secretory pathway pseudopilin PulG